jgi:hypothetical protein
VNLYLLFEGAAHLAPTVSRLLLQVVFITVLRDELSHSPSPAGFVYLEFSWMHAPSLFSSVWPYQPVAIAVLACLQLMWGSAPPHSPAGCPHISHCWKPFPLHAHWGRWHHTRLLQQACLFTVHVGKCPSPTLQQRVPHREPPLPLSPELRAPHPLCSMFFFFSCLLFRVFFWVGAGVSLSRGLC